MIKGGFLRLLQTILYTLTFVVSAIILGVHAYFLYTLTNNGRSADIAIAQRAVVGISAVGVIFTLFGIVLTCCLGGVTLFGWFAVALNAGLMAAMIAVAILLRNGRSCGNGAIGLAAPIGEDFILSGISSQRSQIYCHLSRAAFAASIVAVLLFAMLAVVQLLLVRRGKKDKRYGPGPDNGYTSGQRTSRMPWRRSRNAVPAGQPMDAEMGRPDMRPSHDTAYTGSTVAAPGTQTGFVKDIEPRRY